MDIILLTEVIAVTLILFHILGIVSAVEAIIKVRTAQGAIAWAISLITFPYLAVPCYWVFGRNRFDGYLEQRDQIRQESLELIEQTTNTVEQHIIPRSSENSFYSTLYELARMPATSGNQVELLINGEQTFDSIADGLAYAKKYILFEFYILRDDELGQRLGNIMIEKARAGIKVKVLYDEIGSHTFPKTALHKQMKAAGVKVEPFNTTQGRRNRFQLNFRNHRKIVIVDGLKAWVGGHNVGREYLGLDKKIGHWRDTHICIEGPAVPGIEIAFSTDWRWATRKPLSIDWDFVSAPRGPCNALVFPSDPASQFEETGLMYHQLIVDARKRIWIASPYFVPDRSIISALQLAALRGVDVRVIIPDEPDKRVVAMANWSYTKELLPAGIKVYRYQGGFMHQKVLLMDDRISGVGTANFDNRSFRLNFEITMLIDNPDFAKQISDMLKADMQHSRKVYKEDVKTSLPWLLAMGIARLMSPLL